MNGKQYNKNLSLSLIVIVIITGLIGIAGYYIESEPPLTNNRFYIQNSSGAVLFEHQRHIDLTEGCEVCHHELVLSDDKTECSECHDDDYLPEDLSHDKLTIISDHTCNYCHQVGEYIDIQSCRSCHLAENELTGLVSCLECHDDDYTPEDLSHDEMQEIHEYNCENCHNIQAIGTVYHGYCSECHTNETPQQFTNADGSIRCQNCHLK